MIRRFEDVANACPTPTVGMASRVDPFYTAFADSSQARWLNVDLARRQHEAGLGHLPEHLAMPAEEAWTRITNPSTLHRRLNALAVLDNYRTATGQQIAAITGDLSLASPRSEVMRELFAAGLVDVATLDTGMRTGPARKQVQLYRPARNNAFETRLAPHLTYPEWVSVTGGVPLDSSSQFDRHNTVLTDFCLRAAEALELASIVGEKLSRWDLLTVGSGPAPLHGWQARHADATLIRTDGLKIAIELTASVSSNFRAKVRRYAELFNSRPLHQNGLVVLFLVAAPLGARRRELVNQVRKAVASCARDHPGVSFSRTANRMFVVSWPDYFPSPGHVDDSFFWLAATRPSGPSTALWETASPLDVLDTPFEPRDWDPLAAIKNLSGLRATPHWLRTENPPELWHLAVKRLGFTTGIPFPAPSRPERHTGAPLGASRGAAAQSQPPARLRARIER